MKTTPVTTLWDSLESIQVHDKSKRLIQHFRDFEKRLPHEVDKIVKQHVKNPKKILGKAICRVGNQLSNCDTLDFDEYITRVLNHVNREDLDKLISKVLVHIKKGNVRKFKKLGVNDNELILAIKLNIFFRPYIGFLFEHMIEEYIKSLGYDVSYSDMLDRKYAIDLVVRKWEDGKLIGTIGLQLKSNTFIYLKDKSRYMHKNQSGIDGRWVDDVYYIFHDENSNPMLDLDQMCYMTNFKELNNCENLIHDFEEVDKYFKEELEQAFEKAVEVRKNREPLFSWWK